MKLQSFTTPSLAHKDFFPLKYLHTWSTQLEYLLYLLFSSAFLGFKVFQYLLVESQMNSPSWSSSVYTEDKGS